MFATLLQARHIIIVFIFARCYGWFSDSSFLPQNCPSSYLAWRLVSNTCCFFRFLFSFYEIYVLFLSTTLCYDLVSHFTDTTSRAKCFGGHESFSWGHWYHCFWTSDNICSGFQSQDGSFACVQWIPQIHLWCGTCQLVSVAPTKRTIVRKINKTGDREIK